jgi:PAS domain S-box-containing protein
MNSSEREHELNLKKNLHPELANQNDFFQRVISEVDDYAILLIDPQGIVLTWNKGAENIKGYKASEIIGKSYKVFYLEEDRERKLPEQLLETARTKGKANHEGWRKRKNGTRFWGSVTITAVHADSGDVVAYLKVTRDLTERKIAEQRLQELIDNLGRKNEDLRKSEERYHNMIAEVEDYAIILLDEHGIILDWNLGAQKLKGYSSREIVGSSFRSFYRQVDLNDRLPDRLLETAAKEGKVSHEGWRVRKDGSFFWGSVAITALHDVAGRIIGFTKVTRDLTERKKMEDSLRSTADELVAKNKDIQRLNEELSSFTYVASHDLKEPLRKVITFASRLDAEEALSESGKTHLEKLKASAGRMQSLIEDLLYYSQIAHESMFHEPVDLNELVQQVIGDLDMTIADKKASIRKEHLPSVPGMKFQIHQLFTNILANALKYSRQDVPPVVSISSPPLSDDEIERHGLDPSMEFAHIRIDDNGIGFPPEFSQRIFSPFQRLHSSSKFSGTGIGLAIVKRVAENHRGLVYAEGNPGEGASFHVLLPTGQIKKV